MTVTSFYSQEELQSFGFKSIGENVLLSRKASVYSPDRISIGDNARIDDFCILSGNISIGKYVHIAASCLLYGGEEGIVFEDFTGASSRCAVYAISDDFSGKSMANPTIPEQFRSVIRGRVIVRKYALIGTGCTVLPGSIIGEGSAIGAMSLVKSPLDEWGIYAGIPCRRIKEREKGILGIVENVYGTTVS